MKKKYLFLLCALVFSCFSFVLQAQNFSATNSSGTSIYYNILSSNPNRVEVVHTSGCYSGTLIIPDTVFYSGVAYRVSAIADSAFYGCSSLVSVTLPATIDTIGDNAFYGNTNLTTIYVYASIPPTVNDDFFRNSTSNDTLYVPCSSYNSYRAGGTSWQQFSRIYGMTDTAEYWDTICRFEHYNNYGIDTISDVSGLYITSVMNGSCRIVNILHLYVKPAFHNVINYYFCGTTTDYVANGFNLHNTVGTFEHTDTTWQGCDSNTVLHLIPVSNQVIPIHADICQGKKYTQNGFYITSSRTSVVGTIVDTNYSQSVFAPCDSTAVLILSVHPNIDTIKYDTVCKGSSFLWQTYGYNRNPWGYYYPSYKTYNYDTLAAGNYTFTDTTFTTEYGCKNNHTLNLTVNPTYRDTIYDVICKGERYSQHGFNFVANTSGIYIDTLHTKKGCDSIQILNLTVNPVYNIQIRDTVCQGVLYSQHGFNVSANTVGTITRTNHLQTIKGCDSILNLALVVHPIFSDTTNKTKCEAAHYSWQPTGYIHSANGTYLPSSHTYNYDTLSDGNYIFRDTTLTTQYGCKNNHTLFLKINPIYDTTIHDTVCQGTLYNKYGLNFTAQTSGIYPHTFTSVYGCDSIIKVNLTVNPVYNIQIRDTVCQGVLYSQHGFNVSANTVGTITRTNHLQTIKGCDSILNLALVVHPIFSDTTNKTKCEAAHYSWQPTGYIHSANGTYLPSSHTYNYDTLSDGNYIFRDTTLTTQYGCKNNHTLFLKINPIYDTTIHDTVCQGTFYNKYGLNFTAQTSGIYSHTFTSVYGCDSIIKVYLRVNPTYTNTTQISICSGQTYNFYGKSLSATGSYRDTLQTVAGCDSIQILNLTVNPVYNTPINDNICLGGVYNNHGFHNINADTIGTFTYIDTVQTVKGCDSILTLHLTVNPIYNISLYDTVCKHTTYTKYGFNFLADTSGTYLKHLTTIHGCDSTLTLHLKVNPTYDTTIFAQLCANVTYIANGFNESVTGTYTHHLQTINGCDSVLHLHLTINNQIITTINDTICQGQTYNKNGFTATLSGIYRDTLSSAGYLGCDSVVVLNLIVNPTYEKDIYDTICQGGVYSLHNFNIDSTNAVGERMYTDTLQTIHGCDSVQHLHLMVEPIYAMTLYDSVCKGEHYTLHSFDFIADTSGEYRNTLHTEHFGCDSIQTLHLVVHPTYDTTIRRDICYGTTYSDGVFTQSIGGLYTDTLRTIKGCDSIIHLQLNVYAQITDTINAQICQGESYTLNGFNENTVGRYQDTAQSYLGCDSITVLNLIVNSTYEKDIYDTICQGGVYSLHNFNIDSTNAVGERMYTDTLHTIYGCDSVQHLHLMVEPIYAMTLYDSVCKGEHYTLHSFDFIADTSGEYRNTLHTEHFGCDSIQTLHLVVHPTYDTTIRRDICYGTTYSDGVFTQSIGGLYTDTLRTIKGCDSIIHLQLNVYAQITDTINAQICQGESYTLNGFNENTVGRYQDTAQSYLGCDSITVLNLIVNSTYEKDIYDTICQGGVYSLHNFNIDSTNAVGERMCTDTLQTIHGCDSVQHLHLMVEPIYAMTLYDSVCKGEHYTLHSFDFIADTSGEYRNTLYTEHFGCDSIQTLHLVVHPTYDTTIRRDICYGTTYSDGVFTQSIGGLYTDTLRTIKGCDSIIHLQLNVYAQITDTINAQICQGESYTLNGFNENIAGRYQDTAQSYLGCDSITVLNLIVNSTYEKDIYDTICQGGVYSLHNFNIDSTNAVGERMYTDTLQTIHGCDSVQHLHLMVEPIYAMTLYDSVCKGEHYTLHSFDFIADTSGEYRNTLHTEHFGCDSIQTLHLVVHPTYDTTITAHICYGQTYTDNGFSQNRTGYYTDSLQSINGCDSIVHLDLTVVVYNRTIITSICQGGSYDFAGMTITNAGTYVDTLISTITGCDSIITLHLSVNQPYTDTIRATICQGETYDGYGFHETEQGYHSRLLQTVGYCDSLLVLDLTVNTSPNKVINASICEGEEYTLNGFNERVAGTYRDTLQTVAGCDSIVTLVLNTNPRYNDTLYEQICQGETFNQYGFNETRSGYYVQYLQSSYGCDSTVVLSLRVNPLQTTNIDATICEGERYNENGFYADTTGDYSLIAQDMYGCDSTVYLHLTVHPEYNDTTKAWVRDGEIYRDGEFEETQPGIYTHSYQSMYGCDSIIVLNLRVRDKVHLFLPNAFTPVQKYNNVFSIVTDEEDMRLKFFKIYDRWGKCVFETNDIKQGWDGRFQGKLCPQGTYVYYIQFYMLNTSNENHMKKGTVTVLY